MKLFFFFLTVKEAAQGHKRKSVEKKISPNAAPKKKKDKCKEWPESAVRCMEETRDSLFTLPLVPELKPVIALVCCLWSALDAAAGLSDDRAVKGEQCT